MSLTLLTALGALSPPTGFTCAAVRVCAFVLFAFMVCLIDITGKSVLF